MIGTTFAQYHSTEYNWTKQKTRKTSLVDVTTFHPPNKTLKLWGVKLANKRQHYRKILQ